MRGPGHYLVADDPASPPNVIIWPGQRCTTVGGEELAEQMSLACAPGATAPTAAQDDPGQEAVLDRLLDLLLISVLRAWFARPGAPGWYRAYGDPVVGRALRLLHHNPAHPWTLAELAGQCGASRATLTRRFSAMVGEAPMSFLTNWRISLAADLLREPGASLGAVAHRVGYRTPFALSTAFKRVRGVSPQQYLREAA
jgi:AraC-like DNA-binding protein